MEYEISFPWWDFDDSNLVDTIYVVIITCFGSCGFPMLGKDLEFTCPMCEKVHVITQKELEDSYQRNGIFNKKQYGNERFRHRVGVVVP